MAKLTPRQRAFVDEYLIDLNATQAAIRAGYSHKNASRIAIELLNKTHVSAYLQRRQNDRKHRTEITQDRVLQELAAIGFSKGTDYARIGPNGIIFLTPTDKLSDQQKAAITAIKETQNGVEIKLADKVRALELLGKHLGMFDKGAGGPAQEIENDPLTESIEREIENNGGRTIG